MSLVVVVGSSDYQMRYRARRYGVLSLLVNFLQWLSEG